MRSLAALTPAAVCATLATLVAVVVAPWLRPDLRWNDVADAPNHLVRIYAIDAALRQGAWYPRWLADLYLGYGYPLLNFYAPAMYYVTAALHQLGMTIYASFQWAGVLCVAIGVPGAYALVLTLGGRRDAALLAAAVFALSPYPFLTNLYVRAAVPEALALALLPWLLLATWQCWRRGGAWCAGLAVLVAALLLAHNISALLGVGVLAAWLLMVCWLGGQRRLPALARTLLAVGAGLGLSALFWLPALLESSLVQIRLAQGDFYDPKSWLFDPLHLLGKAARPEYPHTRLGPADLRVIFDYGALGQGAPEKISLWQLVFWAVAFAVAIGAGVAARARHGTERPRGAACVALTRRERALLALFWLGVAAACWFMNTTWSRPLWASLPLLGMAQFPWRLYGPLALALAAGAGLALAALPARGRSAWGSRAIVAALAGLLAFGSLAARPITLGKEPAHDVDERDLAALEFNRYGAGTTSGGEFLPTTVHWEEDKWVGDRRGIRVYEDAYPQASWQAGLVRLLAGRAAVEGIASQPDRIVAEVDAETPATLAVHQLLFPGWRGYVDGRPVELRPAETVVSVPVTLGFIVLDVPTGHHEVEVRFGSTPTRTLANALSAATLAAGLAWLLWRTLLAHPIHLATRERRPWPWLPAAAPIALAAIAAGCTVAGTDWSVRPGRPLPSTATRVVLDVAGAVKHAQAQTFSPNNQGAGILPPYLDVGFRTVAGDERRWLYMHPTSAVAVHLHVPPHAYFQAGLALDPETWFTPTGDGVRFIVQAEGPQGSVVLLNQHVNPRARGEDRRWIDTWVSLAPLAGQDARLILRTDPADDATFDWAGWANPQVVIWDGARPNPGAEHKW